MPVFGGQGRYQSGQGPAPAFRILEATWIGDGLLPTERCWCISGYLHKSEPGPAGAEVEAQAQTGGHRWLEGEGPGSGGQSQAGLPIRLAVAWRRLAATKVTSSQGSWRSARPKWP